MIHMGSTDGFIWRVDSGEAEELYRRGDTPPLPRDRPNLPITHVIEDPEAAAVVAAPVAVFLADEPAFPEPISLAKNALISAGSVASAS